MSVADELDLYGGLQDVSDRVRLLAADMLDQGMDPAIVLVGMLSAVGVVAGVTIWRESGRAADGDVLLDLAVLARSNMELAGAIVLEDADDIATRAADVVSAQHVVACDLRDLFGQQGFDVPSLMSAAAKGNA